MVYIIRPRFDPHLEAAGGAVSYSISLGTYRGRDCRLGISTAEAWGNHGGIYPMLQRGQEPMLLNLYFREGGGRVGILGTTKSDQGSGFPIGVQFFGALGAKVNNI
jgi:hypothetical protein